MAFNFVIILVYFIVKSVMVKSGPQIKTDQ